MIQRMNLVPSTHLRLPFNRRTRGRTYIVHLPLRTYHSLYILSDRRVYIIPNRWDQMITEIVVAHGIVVIRYFSTSFIISGIFV